MAHIYKSDVARVNEGSHSFTCHPHVYPQVEWTIPAFTPQPQSITALWLVLISRPAEGRRLSWPRWLGEILRWFVLRRRSPIPVLTGPDVEYPRWYAKRRYRYATSVVIVYLSYTVSEILPNLQCRFTWLPVTSVSVPHIELYAHVR